MDTSIAMGFKPLVLRDPEERQARQLQLQANQLQLAQAQKAAKTQELSQQAWTQSGGDVNKYHALMSQLSPEGAAQAQQYQQAQAKQDEGIAAGADKMLAIGGGDMTGQVVQQLRQAGWDDNKVSNYFSKFNNIKSGITPEAQASGDAQMKDLALRSGVSSQDIFDKQSAERIASNKVDNQAPTELSRLIAERAKLPANDPMVKTYTNAIRKASETSSQIVPPSNFNVTQLSGLNDAEKAVLYPAMVDGRIDPNRVNSRTAKIFAQALLTNPSSDLAKVSGDIALGRNAGFRTKAIVAETLPEIMGNMVETGKKLDFSDVRAVGKMQAWSKGQLNDPTYTEYMGQRNDALMTIAGVMRGVGMTDMAHKAETEVAAPSMSPKALEAWYSGQMKSLEPRLKMYRGITQSKDVNQQPQSSAPAASSKAIDFGSLK